jgi:hypothetical protein
MTQTPGDDLEPAFLIPRDFHIQPVDPLITAATGGISPHLDEDEIPPLGPLAAFTGTFVGTGFNTIFRPKDTGLDNLLELNLTSETLSFIKSLGQVPNRGMVQDNIGLNGVPYIQSIKDITDPKNKKDIHFEPGLWMAVPSTTHPEMDATLVRMASIPHGTTFTAQGTSTTGPGKPTIPPVNTAGTTPPNGLTPFVTDSQPPDLVSPFPSQTAKDKNTDRLPVDLAPFIAAGTITQEILDDPNLLLRNHIDSQDITETTTITIRTDPEPPLFGGGVNNIPFLLGNPAAQTNPAPKGPNAQTLSMQATFWIETVRHTIVVGPGHQLTLKPETSIPGQPAPTFTLDPATDITEPRTITVTTTQIQYSQVVMLNFNTLTWPHVSVATLVPLDPIPVLLT